MRNLIARMAAVGVATLTAAFAFGEAEYLDVIAAKYKFAETSKAAEKACAICHVSDEDFSFNPYGQQVKAKLTANNTKTVTDELLTSMEAEDADGDGKSNGDELKAGELAGHSDAPAGTTTPAPPPPAKPLIPKNAYHPAIVHFPIALLVVGLLLDLIGLIKKDTRLLYAGWYNTVAAAVTSLGAVASGFVAMTWMKLPYKGLIFNHLLYAIVVTVIMWLMVALRVHRHEKMNIPIRALYWILAIASFLIISWTGHLGGAFVYGD